MSNTNTCGPRRVCPTCRVAMTDTELVDYCWRDACMETAKREPTVKQRREAAHALSEHFYAHNSNRPVKRSGGTSRR